MLGEILIIVIMIIACFIFVIIFITLFKVDKNTNVIQVTSNIIAAISIEKR